MVELQIFLIRMYLFFDWVGYEYIMKFSGQMRESANNHHKRRDNMVTREYSLWNTTSNMCQGDPIIQYYKPENKTTDMAVIIFPGGAYCSRAEHEGKGYAKFLNQNGISAFVVQYRVSPHLFPLPLLDARRGIKFVRYNAEKFGIDKNKIAVMGSSAGGHLAALVSTYMSKLDIENVDEIESESFIPNAQILCYPVIDLYDNTIAHMDSAKNLIGNDNESLRKKLSPNLLVNNDTPMAFIWHTFEDAGVNVRNSLEYACELRNNSIPTELHIFPHGEHGLGLTKRATDVEKHISLWSDLLIRWLKYIGWLIK